MGYGEDKMSIPKIIHYCWFGGKPLPKLAVKCINSWKKYLPDYEIKEWNENNFDVNICKYCSEAYTEKKWAFVSDFVRIYVLVNFGGIYMDTDVEVVKSFDETFLQNEAFSGFETTTSIPTGIMASIPGQRFFSELLEVYISKSFIKNDGKPDLTTNVQLITEIGKKYGLIPNNSLQTINGFTLYPQTYFCPLSHSGSETCISDQTYTIHHFAGSWCDRKTKFVGKWNTTYKTKITNLLGESIATIVYKSCYNICRLFDNIYHK